MVLSRAWSDRDRKTVRLIRQLFSYMREKGVDADPKDFAGTLDQKWEQLNPPE